ncbi:MAG: chemotaxis protein CheX [Vampirovibrionales bacterium]|nr:chemotaxis protein CheX [Vampirovibrionales bacterium]
MTTQSPAKSVLDAGLVNAVIEATTEVFNTMAATPVTLKGILPQDDYRPQGDISGIIGIVGDDGEGMVAMSFSLELGNLMVGRLLGMEGKIISSEDRSDGVGELLNMISGRAKAMLSADKAVPYRLSLPTVIQGSHHEISSRPKNSPYLVVQFMAEDKYPFNLQVSFKHY